VVVQALNCGLPCVVSDRVGAADLIEHHRNGSIFPAGDSGALAEEIAWWLRNPPASSFPPLTWDGPAQRLIELSQSI
jgi:glycosyltransferase involved in cell wall biosynthesis